jgi:uncharacterized protein (TIGR02147 family)
MVNVFDYVNSRRYLKDWFDECKKENKAFSHRILAEQLGLLAPNFILLVMQEKRNLNRDLRIKISRVMEHSPKEAEYFEYIVGFSQAKTDDEKRDFWSKIMNCRKEVKVVKINDQNIYEYFSNWYNPAVRELIASPDFDGNPETLCKLLQPSISASQAKASIELLQELDLIKKVGDRYEQTSGCIGTDNEVKCLAVSNFHREMANLGLSSMDRMRQKERFVTGATVYITERMYEEVQKRIDALKKEVFAIEKSDSDGKRRVYHLNCQLFPLSKKQ